MSPRRIGVPWDAPTYRCPTCGAKEDERHLDSCTLHGFSVLPDGQPLNSKRAESYLEEELPHLRSLHPAGSYVLLDIESLLYVVAPNYNQAQRAFVERWGPTSPTGRHFFGQTL